MGERTSNMNPGLEEAMEYVEAGEKFMKDIKNALQSYLKIINPGPFDLIVKVKKKGPGYDIEIGYHPENEK